MAAARKLEAKLADLRAMDRSPDAPDEAVVRDALRAWLEWTPADRAESEQIVLAVWETCANAVVHGHLDPVTGVATGRLRLDRGSLMTLMMHTGAARALVATAQKIDTEFPDE